MSIKDILNELEYKSPAALMENSYKNYILKIHPTLSNSDIKVLSSYISKFRNNGVEKTLKTILLFCFWSPDEAVEISKKKGVFRYSVWGIENNSALYLLEHIKKHSKIVSFSQNTLDYINTKIKMSWLFEFYKTTESQLVSMIKERHAKRIISKVGNIVLEEGLFKNLLAYLDIKFHNLTPPTAIGNKNVLKEYSSEEISESISYLVFLFDKTIGIKSYVHYCLNAEYILSDDIEKLILLGCKICTVQEWEVCLDYFDYKVKTNGNQYTIFSSDENFEKSIKLGYVRNALQQMSFYNKGFSKFENSKGLVDLCKYTTKKIGNMLVEKIGKGITARYRVPIPELLFDIMKTPNGELYKEETLEFAHLASNMISPYQDLLDKQVTNHCRLKDVVLFKRAFVILDLLLGTVLYKQKDQERIASSLVPVISEEQIIKFADRFLENRIKTKELLDLFTYNPDYKLDLQYTPFLKIGHNYLIPFSLVGKSFLIRNCIEYSYLIKNQIVNQDDKEFLVLECKKVFEKRKELYTVFTNRKFKYDGRNGEIDVIVVSDKDVFIIECKCPLYPTSNFELRGTFDHIKKASSQLDLASRAFNDHNFAKQYFKNLNVPYKERNIRTCVIMGNRLFNGWNIKSHPIRFIYELDMTINDGYIYSNIGNWRIWSNPEFCNDDLIEYLSSDSKFISSNFNSMNKVYESLYFKDKKLSFESYAFDLLKSIDTYDNYFHIESRDETLYKKIKMQIKTDNRP